MKPKPIRKAITIYFYSEGRMDLDRGYKTIFLKILLSFIQHEKNFFDLTRINQSA